MNPLFVATKSRNGGTSLPIIERGIAIPQHSLVFEVLTTGLGPVIASGPDEFGILHKIGCRHRQNFGGVNHSLVRDTRANGRHRLPTDVADVSGSAYG